MIEHRINGRRALTIADLAAKYDLGVNAINSIIRRERLAGREIPIADTCGRNVLYDEKTFDRVMRARPGKGHRVAPD